MEICHANTVVADYKTAALTNSLALPVVDVYGHHRRHLTNDRIQPFFTAILPENGQVVSHLVGIEREVREQYSSHQETEANNGLTNPNVVSRPKNAGLRHVVMQGKAFLA